MLRPSRVVGGLPAEEEDVFEEFRTCEMSTLARDGTPITWPTLPFWYSAEKRGLARPRIPWYEINAAKKRAVSFWRLTKANS